MFKMILKLYNCTIQQLSVHGSLKYRCVFQYYIVYFLFYDFRKCYRVQLWIATRIYFFIKTDSHNVLLRFHEPSPLASRKGLLNTNWQYITDHISQTPPSHIYVPHLLIFCERPGSSLAAEIIFVMSSNKRKKSFNGFYKW